MKRLVGLLLVVIACVIGFLSVRGTLPFMPVFGTSMEPTLHTGTLILIEPVLPGDVKVGDVIVFNVPQAIRDHYNYPPVVSHRVININKGNYAMRTKGDNTGEDPFTVMPWEIRGKVGSQIPNLGFPLLFMQSQQGLIFVIVSLALLALFLYGNEINLARRRTQKGIFAPVLEESQRSNKVLSHKIEVTEKRMDGTQVALEKFAGAIEEYAKHLASHTSAIQGLSTASNELSKSAAEQNKVLAHLMNVAEKPRVIEYKPAEVKPVETKSVTSATPPDIDKLLSGTKHPAPAHPAAGYPPGCFRSRRSRSQQPN